MAKPDWITLSKSSGSGNGTVTVTAAKNTGTSARSGSITVKSGSLSRVVSVSQEGQSTPKGKITLNYTGATIPYEYEGFTIFVGNSGTKGSVEFYTEYGVIESITNTQIKLNIDNITESQLNYILGTLNSGDLAEMDDLWFGISSEEDPGADWTPLLLTQDAGDLDFTSDNLMLAMQKAYAGTDQIISCTSLIKPDNVTITWGVSASQILRAAITQDILDDNSLSSIDFTVNVDLYPDGERLSNSSLNGVYAGTFTLGLLSGQSLSQPVEVETDADLSFVWTKEWSTVSLCRITISTTAANDMGVSLSENLIINNKVFTKHDNGNSVYFENLEGIPLEKTDIKQQIILNSNIPTMNIVTLG